VKLTTVGDPVPDPLLLIKSGSAGNRTRDLWVSSQKLLLLDHRGGRPVWNTQRTLGFAPEALEMNVTTGTLAASRRTPLVLAQTHARNGKTSGNGGQRNVFASWTQAKILP
jgi:hypothetical protein